MTEPSAKILLDSINPWGNRLTTMEVVIHRFVLAEINTHRMLSRNSASSRAIPVRKQIERVKNDPALPLVWASEKPGMQGGEPLDKPDTLRAKKYWLQLRDEAVKTAQALVNSDYAERNLHKSLVNRILEPWMWHTVIISATEWTNFFNLRCNPMAQPEFRVAAEAMKSAYEASEPTQLLLGEWHLPYIEDEDRETISEAFPNNDEALDAVKRISAARCARVSYLNQGGGKDWGEDFTLANRLAEAGHWSPFEHVALPTYPYYRGNPGNFVGFRQFRHELDLARNGVPGQREGFRQPLTAKMMSR